MTPFLIATPAPKTLLQISLDILFPERYVTPCIDPTVEGLETCMIFDLTIDEFVEIHESINDVLIYRLDDAQGNMTEARIDSF